MVKVSAAADFRFILGFNVLTMDGAAFPDPCIGYAVIVMLCSQL